MSDLVAMSAIEEKYTSTGRQSGYQVNLHHEGLDEYKYLVAIDIQVLEGKIHNQIGSWQIKWDKECQKARMQSKSEEAEQRTIKAQERIQVIENILQHTLNIDDTIEWDSLYHHDNYASIPDKHKFIQYNDVNGYPQSIKTLNEPHPVSKHNFIRKISLRDRLLGKTKRILKQQETNYQNALSNYAIELERVAKENLLRQEALSEQQEVWKKEEAIFLDSQKSHNKSIDRLKELYLENNSIAIVEYCEMVLNNSEYPDNFPQSFDIQYNEINGMLLVDYQLPSISNMPSINNVRYIKARKVIEEKQLSQSARSKLYDSAIYQIALRTLHEIFEADSINAITAINLNGIVTDINPATGHKESNCIISIQANKEEFEQINLEGIVSALSYKECFKSLRGVGSSKLSSMTAIKPLIELNKSDRRFRNHYEVASSLNEAVNIASMPWEDFEHLVREMFAKEFTENGGEVRVTQASRDGGVDAIAFDPDPIRGGKIVIQAKRYTNIVGVSAVRDLYGTVMNEGATKGILVTTSDYGSDSYEFAKGKPLSLLNGSNLLHLLQKHGHKAKIDIKEAKKTLKSEAA